MSEIQPKKDIRYICRHIFTDGHRCSSPALRKQDFCYYHHTTRQPVAGKEARARKLRRNEFILPRPEDRTAVQLSIGEVLDRVSTNRIDTKRAGLLLYGLQTASANLPTKRLDENPPAPVEEVVDEPQLGLVAPTRECDPAPKDLHYQLQEDFREERNRYLSQIQELEAHNKALYRETFVIFMELKKRVAEDPSLQPIYDFVCKANKDTCNEYSRRHGYEVDDIDAVADESPGTVLIWILAPKQGGHLALPKSIDFPPARWED
jgi:hypothetical protein